MCVLKKERTSKRKVACMCTCLCASTDSQIGRFKHLADRARTFPWPHSDEATHNGHSPLAHQCIATRHAPASCPPTVLQHPRRRGTRRASCSAPVKEWQANQRTIGGVNNVVPHTQGNFEQVLSSPTCFHLTLTLPLRVSIFAIPALTLCVQKRWRLVFHSIATV